MRLVPLADLDGAGRAATEALYDDAFPDELRAPFADLLTDRLLVGVDEGGPAGLALVRDLGETGWTFLRYYAVARRGQGQGTLLWAELTDLLAAEGRTRLVWDVEDPDEPGLPAAEVAQHRRRIAFYERLGGRLLPVRGYRPPHDGVPVPLLLMDAPLVAGPEAGLRRLVEGVLELRYGLSPDDDAVRGTLGASGLL